jgi:outer membrane lipoprotein carrier protein
VRNGGKRNAFSFLFLVALGGGICFALVGFFLPGMSRPSDSPSVSEVLRGVQERYQVTDFEADFVQESQLKAIGVTDSAAGHVYFRPPAMMRWHYRTPEDYVIVTEGENVWIYRPEENQVMMGRGNDYFGDIEWAAFFSRPERLLEHFAVAFAEGVWEGKDRFVLRLLPKKRLPNLAQMLLFISRDTFDIVQAVACNPFGDETTIRFDNFKFNQGLDMSMFRFKVPEGADLLHLEGE